MRDGARCDTRISAFPKSSAIEPRAKSALRQTPLRSLRSTSNQMFLVKHSRFPPIAANTLDDPKWSLRNASEASGKQSVFRRAWLAKRRSEQHSQGQCWQGRAQDEFARQSSDQNCIVRFHSLHRLCLGACLRRCACMKPLCQKQLLRARNQCCRRSAASFSDNALAL